MSQNVYPDKSDISQRIIQQLAQIIGLDEMQIDSNSNLSSFGLDSAAIMGIVIELEEKLGIRVNPDVLYDDQTIDELASKLARIVKNESCR